MRSEAICLSEFVYFVLCVTCSASRRSLLALILLLLGHLALVLALDELLGLLLDHVPRRDLGVLLVRRALLLLYTPHMRS